MNIPSMAVTDIMRFSRSFANRALVCRVLTGPIFHKQAAAAIEAAAAGDSTAGGWHGVQLRTQSRVGFPASLRRFFESKLISGAFGWAPAATPVPTRSQPVTKAGVRQPAGSVRKPADKQRSDAAPMLAVTTANVWKKSELMLHSLAAVKDPFQLLVSFRMARAPFYHLSMQRRQ